jgi:hypothetical protein
MIWQPPAGPSSQPLPRRRRRLAGIGAAVAALALVWVVVFAVRLVTHIGAPMAQSLTSPVQTTPLDRPMTLEHSEYAVYELTGHTSGGGGVTFSERRSVTVSPSQVTVTGPDGAVLQTHGPGFGTETLPRGQDIFTAAVYFTAPASGSYRVQVDSGSAQVVIARSMSSGLSGARPDLVAVTGGSVTLLIGVVLLIVGLVRGRSRRAVAMPAGAPVAAPGQAGRAVSVPDAMAAPPGWYADPENPQQWRFWDGRAWAGPPR